MRNKITILFLAIYSLGLSHVEAQNEVPVSLGRAENFAILSGSGITNHDQSTVTGNVGAGQQDGTISGLSPEAVNGIIFSTDTVSIPGSLMNELLLAEALEDAKAARAFIEKTCYDFTEIFDGDLSGQTLIPGVYEWTGGARVNRDVTISGNANDIWILKVLGPLHIASDTRILLEGDVNPENIFWYVTDKVFIGQDAKLEGIILAAGDVTLGRNTVMHGRLFTEKEVILDNNTIKSDTNPRITVTKTADKQSFLELGEIINFTIVVSNTGNVALTDIIVTDPLTDLMATIPILNPQQSIVYEQSYAIRLIDIYGGTLHNIATATGKDPQGNDVSATGEAILSVQYYNAELTVEKSADKATFSAIGELITYTLIVRNSGSVFVYDIDVLDPLTGFEANIDTLKTCNRRTYIITYETTYEDMCRGYIKNTATAIGVDSRGEFTGASDEVTITGDFEFAELSIVKTASQSYYSGTGEEIIYTILLSNTGHVPINNIVVTDPLTGLNQTISTLRQCESVSIETNYVITLADMLTGLVTNTVTASGKDPQGQDVSDSDQEVITAITDPQLKLTKIAGQDTYQRVGETVTYTIMLENTGNVSISDISLMDDLTAESWFHEMLLPDSTIVLTTSYEVTQNDLDTGTITNTVTATGSGPQDQLLELSAQEVITAVAASGLSVSKTASQTTYSTPGEVINYTITVENIGNITLYDIEITDNLTGDDWLIQSLAPKNTQSFSASYSITQEDIDNSFLTNLVLVSGLDNQGEAIEEEAEETIDAALNPGIEIIKSAGQSTYDMVGQTINYTILVRNTGNLTLYDIEVTDELTGDNWTVDLLAPGDEISLTTSYTTTQEDVDNGFVTNVATVSAKGPQQQVVEDTDSLTIEAFADARLTLTKTAGQQTYSYIGEQITYSIIVGNNGNVTVNDIVITDDLTGEQWSVATLLPSQQVEYTTIYLVTAADLDTGNIMNTATASGKDPDNQNVTASDQETVTAVINAGIAVSKTADISIYSQLGEVITYAIVLQNTGNVTIREILIHDDLTGDNWQWESLPAGEQIEMEASYAISQEDLDRGELMNIVTGSGLDPNQQAVSAEDEEIIYAADLTASIIISKTADRQTYASPGEQITYTITVTNNGQLTVRNIELTDDLTNDSWSVESLAPGESRSFTAVYEITQEDIDRGSVVNLVAAQGSSPVEEPVNADDQETVVADVNASITLTKTASPSTYSQPGQQITYTITARNTGNVTLTDVEITDEVLGQTWYVAILRPGEQAVYQPVLFITQLDMDLGSHTNIVNVTATDPNNEAVTDSAEEIILAVNRQPAISVMKSSERPVYAVTGDVIAYTIVVTNSGNLTIYDIQVTDDLTNSTWNIAVLAPGESQSFSTTYTVNNFDINLGQVVNIAAAQGFDPDGNTVSDFDEETAIAIRVPGGLTPDTPFDNILIIKGLDYYPNNNFRIFNRYGTLVYEASPYRNDWVGVPNRGLILTDGDGKVPAGTYFYMLILEPGQKPFTGYIYLIKN